MTATRQTRAASSKRGGLEDVPEEAWRTAYPLPYREPLENEARRNHLDPMLVAGLIRQESAFCRRSGVESQCGRADAGRAQDRSRLARSDCACGFSRARLFDPEYNLRLGTVYLSDLLAAYGTPEAALAAYNAGEDRVAQWTTGQNYAETPEFVESIPFTETREYVQIVLRNAELYRRIYSRPTLRRQRLRRRLSAFFFASSFFRQSSFPAAGHGILGNLRARVVLPARRENERIHFGANPLSMAIEPMERHEQNRTGNPAIGPPQDIAQAARAVLSAKAEQFTESVIREMTRLALQHGAVNLAQGFPDFPGACGNQGSGARGHRRRRQSVRHHLGSQAAARRHRRKIRAHPGRHGRSRSARSPSVAARPKR